MQLNLFFETAESPQGDVGGADTDRSASAPFAVPKSKTTERIGTSAMTMEAWEVDHRPTVVEVSGQYCLRLG